LFASSWYIFLTYIYDARSHLQIYQIILISLYLRWRQIFAESPMLEIKLADSNVGRTQTVILAPDFA